MKKTAEELSAYKRKYYLKNRERILASVRGKRQEVSTEQRRIYRAAHYAKHGDKRREEAREKYHEDRLAILARRKARRETDPTVLEKARKWRGLPEPTRPCPPCCENPNCKRLFEPGKIHLDHCHVTGRFRGWLCNRCNLAFGHLGDSKEGLLKSSTYFDIV